MLRCCRSANDLPSVTMYWTVLTFEFSIVGLKTSDRTPSATVNQTFEVVLRAVPKQSLRAKSIYAVVPGPPGAEPPAYWALETEAAIPIPQAQTSSSVIASRAAAGRRPPSIDLLYPDRASSSRPLNGTDSGGRI